MVVMAKISRRKAIGKIGASGLLFLLRGSARNQRRTAAERIEEWPKSSELEMVFAKGHGRTGELRAVGSAREKNTAKIIGLGENDRSIVHTHNYKSNSKEHLLTSSNISFDDVLELVEHSLNELKKNPEKIPLLRTTHVAVLGSNGKVIGYSSLHLGKKIIKNRRMLELLYAQVSLYKNFAKDYPLVEVYPGFLKFLEKLCQDKAGIQLHHIALGGYSYKDHIFKAKNE